jgi:hypothetical protein
MVAMSPRYQSTIAAIDAANAADPRQERIDGVMRPVEVIYAERMTACLARLYPEATETLSIAARAQHLCRWQIPRDTYPLGREGYNAWRGACRIHHAMLTADIMRRHGYSAAEIAQVGKMIRKEELKRDAESQALENVAAVVFVEHQLADFIAAHPDYDDAKVAGILRKTLRKMDGVGHAGALALDLTAHGKRLVALAVQGS